MTTLSARPNTLQASLIDALAGAQPEQALTQAFHQLSRGGDLPLLLAAVKALVRIGLAGIAVRLLNASGGLLAAEPQISALASQLSALPSGEVSDAELKRRLQANREAIHAGRSEQAAAIGLGVIDPEWRVFQSKAGNYHIIRCNRENVRLDFVFPFVDHQAQTNALAIPPVTLDASYLLLGVPSIPLWRRLVTLRTPHGYEPPIDLIETDVNVLTLWLSLLNESDASALRSDRVAVFAGEHAVATYRDFLSHHSWRTPATHTITNLRPRWAAPRIDRSFHEAIARTVRQRNEIRKAQLDEQYEHRDVNHWRTRFQSAGSGSPPLKILGFTTRYSTVIQHSMRDLASAFNRKGCDFVTVKQPNNFAAHVNVLEAMTTHQPDMVVVINHVRKEYREVIPERVPFVCWIQDHMPALWNAQVGQSIDELQLVVGHGRNILVPHYGYPAERFLPSSNVTAPDVFSNEPLDAAMLAPYRCDLSYVGHGSETPSQLIEEMSGGDRTTRDFLSGALGLVIGVIQQHGGITNTQILDVIDQVQRHAQRTLTEETIRSGVAPAVKRIVDRYLRHETLLWCANWARANRRTMRIYGKGWDRHPSLREFACNEIEHGLPLRCVYQASLFNLQVNGYASLHQRLLDAFASGGLVLTRFNPADFDGLANASLYKVPPEAQTPLRTASEIDGFSETVFRNESELHSLLQRLIGDEGRRASLVQRARASILQHDTYDVVCEKILQHFRNLPPCQR